MVNNLNVSFFSKSPPPSTPNGERLIEGGPIYDKGVMLSIIKERGERCFRQFTADCIEDLQAYSLDAEDVIELLEYAIDNGRYVNSLWCLKQNSGPWVACDAYEVSWRQWPRWYVKLCLGITGQILLLVSCHPSKH